MDIKDIACLYGTTQPWRPTVKHYWNTEVITGTVISTRQGKLDATGKVARVTSCLLVSNQKFPRNVYSVHSVSISASGIATRQINIATGYELWI
jgi:hypothetical protein